MVKITLFPPFSTDQLWNSVFAAIPNCILYQLYMGVCWVSELFLQSTDLSFYHWILFSCLQGTALGEYKVAYLRASFTLSISAPRKKYKILPYNSYYSNYDNGLIQVNWVLLCYSKWRKKLCDRSTNILYLTRFYTYLNIEVTFHFCATFVARPLIVSSPRLEIEWSFLVRCGIYYWIWAFAEGQEVV